MKANEQQINNLVNLLDGYIAEGGLFTRKLRIPDKGVAIVGKYAK